eukprot:Gb_10088 [translate_table: standard]
MRHRGNSWTSERARRTSSGETMRIRKEGKRFSRGRNGRTESPRLCGFKRKGTEDASEELVRTVLGAEGMSLSPEDSFEGSNEERKIFTSFFPREEESWSSSENTRTTDVSSESGTEIMGLSSTSMGGGKNGYVPTGVELSALKDNTVSQGMWSPGIKFRGREFDGGKDEFRDVKDHKLNEAIHSSMNIQKKIRTLDNVRQEIEPPQELKRKSSVGTWSVSECDFAIEKFSILDVKKAGQENGKTIEISRKEILGSEVNHSDLQECYNIADGLQVEFEQAKRRKCDNNVIQREEGGKICTVVQAKHTQEDVIDSRFPAAQGKKYDRRMRSPIVESSEGGMLLSHYVAGYSPVVNASNRFGADRANKNTRCRISTPAPCNKMGVLSRYSDVGSSADTEDSTMNPSLANKYFDVKIVDGTELDVKDKSKSTFKRCKRVSLPVVSKERQAGNKSAITELRKNLRERAKVRLLAAGWKIQLKPRVGRDYQDSVYVSPWGSSFWSLPKAWNALRQSLDANVTKNGNISSSTRVTDKKRLQGSSFWSDLKDTLMQLDSSNQNLDASTSDQVNEVNPLMSMVFTEDLSLLKRRKKDRYMEAINNKRKEDIDKKAKDRKDKDSKTSMKGHKNGQMLPYVDSKQLCKEVKKGANIDGLYAKCSETQVCEERTIHGQLLGAGEHNGMIGKLSNTGELKNIRGKLPDTGEQRGTHGKALKTIYGKLSDAAEQRSIHGQFLHAGNQRNMQGKLLNAGEQRSVCGKLLDACNQGSMQRKLLLAGNQRSIHGKLSNSGAQKIMSDKLSHASDQRSIHGKLLHAGNQKSIDGKLLNSGEQRSMPKNPSHAGNARSIHEKLVHCGDVRNMHKKISHAVDARSIREKTLHAVDQRSIYEKPPHDSDVRNLHEKLSHVGDQRGMHDKLLSKKWSHDGDVRNMHEKLLHAGDVTGMHEKLLNAGHQRSIHGKLLHTGEIEQELFTQRKTCREMSQQQKSAELLQDEHCNEGHLKGMDVAQKEKSESRDAQLLATRMLKGVMEKLDAINTITHLKVSSELQKLKDNKSDEPQADRESDEPEAGLAGGTLNELQVDPAGMKSNKAQVRQSGRKLNEPEAGRKPNESQVGQGGRKSNEPEVSRKPNEPQVRQGGRKSNEVEACRRSREQEAGRMPNELEEDRARRASEPPAGQTGGNSIESQAGREFDEPQTGRISNASQSGREFDEPQTIGVSNESQAGKMGRLSSELKAGIKSKGPQVGQTGRAPNEPQAGKSGRVSNEPQTSAKSNGSQAGKIGRVSSEPQAGIKSNEAKAVQTGRKSKDPRPGKKLNQPQVGRCFNIDTENMHVRAECESTMKISEASLDDDDDITLASLLKKRKCGWRARKGLGNSCNEDKISSGKTNSLPGKKNENLRGGCVLLVRTSGKGDSHSDGDKDLSSKRKRSVLSWLIDVGAVSENEPVEYLNRKSNRVMKDGWVTRDGIVCRCCSRVLTISNFKAHAGSKVQRPFSNIFLKSGKSLTMCQIQAWSTEYKSRKGGMRMIEVDENDQNDDACGLCGDGGDLICCDRCPSTFHQDCLTLKDIPEGNWYCPNCTCAICGTVGHDEEQDNISTVLICDQCQHKYHKKCLHERDIQAGELKAKTAGFCGQDCEKISAGLHRLLAISNPIEGGFSWTLLKCLDEDQKVCSIQRLALMAECNTKLAVALAVMEECFEPMVDPRTGIDMIPHVVYNWGSNFNRLNYQGFYTVVLEKGNELISVASIRIHGGRLAEMPLIGTCYQYRRQGMCRRLVNAIEEMLKSLKVEMLVLSAIPDLLETWIAVFGFKPLEDSHKEEIRNLRMMMFPGTTLLQKSIFKPEMMKDDQTGGEHVEQPACVKGYDLNAQTQGDDAKCQAPEMTHTESACCVPGDITDVHTIIKIASSRILLGPEKMCEHDKDFGNTLAAGRERTKRHPKGDCLDAQSQEDNTEVLKTCTESVWPVPSNVTDGNTITETSPSRLLPGTEEILNHERGLGRTLATGEEKARNCHSGDDLDVQAQGDKPEVAAVEKTYTDSAWCVPGDMTDVSRTEISASRMFLGAEERWQRHTGLSKTLAAEEERTCIVSNGDDLYAQAQVDSAKDQAVERTSTGSAWCVPGDTCDFKTTTETAASRMLSGGQEIWKPEKVLGHALATEEERIGSLPSGDDLGAQSHGNNPEAPAVEKACTESALCASGDIACVIMETETAASVMLPEAEENALEAEEGRFRICPFGDVLDAQGEGDHAKAPALEKAHTESAWFAPGVMADVISLATATSRILPRIEERWKPEKGFGSVLAAEEERTMTCLSVDDLNAQVQEDNAKAPAIGKAHIHSACCIPGDIVDISTITGTAASRMLPGAEEIQKPDKALGNILAAEEERSMSHPDRDFLDAQEQGDDAEAPALGKAYIQSACCVTGDIADVITTTKTTTSRLLLGTEEKWKPDKGSGNTLASKEARTTSHPDGDDMDFQADGDNGQAPVLEKAHMESSWGAHVGTTIETAASRMLPREEEIWKQQGLGNTSAIERERIMSQPVCRQANMEMATHLELEQRISPDNALSAVIEGEILDFCVDRIHLAEQCIDDAMAVENSASVPGSAHVDTIGNPYIVANVCDMENYLHI